MKALHTISFILVIIGGLNWLIVGLFDRGIADLIGYPISRIVYVLVGIAAIYLIVDHKRTCKQCVSSTSTSPVM
ncbi:MAG TPA: DUF378 domain-containing protein [Candidatus Paceibacterota bacterium]